jgi:hypothetical protein
MLSGKIYEVLKWLSIICLPAIAVLVSSLGQIWGWVDADKITLTINAVALCIGAIIGISTYQYNKEIKG